MLVVTRKVGQRVVIGNNVVVTVVRIAGGLVRIGIEAPPNCVVVRKELLDDTSSVANPTLPAPCTSPPSSTGSGPSAPRAVGEQLDEASPPDADESAETRQE
ncbi:MAG: carbon storage regulator [Pirellulales bacterium]